MQPESLVVFGPMILFGLCCLVLTLAFIFLIIYLIKKGKDQAWTGIVVAKKFNKSTDMDDNTQDNYYFEVKLDDGKTRKIAVSSKFYNEIAEGDKLKKEKGKLWPTKI